MHTNKIIKDLIKQCDALNHWRNTPNSAKEYEFVKLLTKSRISVKIVSGKTGGKRIDRKDVRPEMPKRKGVLGRGLGEPSCNPVSRNAWSGSRDASHTTREYVWYVHMARARVVGQYNWSYHWSIIGHAWPRVPILTIADTFVPIKSLAWAFV